jgi:type I restriction enzyme, S subunit
MNFGQIGDVALKIDSWNPIRDGHDRLINYIDLSSIGQDTKTIQRNKPIVAKEAPSRARQLIQEGDVLVSTVRPNLNGVAMVDKSLDGATASTGFCVLRPNVKKLNGSYLFHWVKTSEFISDMVRKSTGASYPAVSDRIILESKIPLPPIAEQKRIAAILDKAEEIRSQRRQALEQLDALTQSIFLEMFGNPVTNPKGWKSLCFQDVLSVPLRNGLSPSNSGTVLSKVLTLSAITGNEFRDSAVKTSTFQTAPPVHQTVNDIDFLICRGNGNIRLVGKAYFPNCSMLDVIFPDTIIAAQVKQELIDRAFLQYVWSSDAVRSQIESLARTTNGTFKINQTMLEGISLLIPPIALQQEFARRVETIAQLKTTHRESLAQLDDLFSSLQHRAFRGEL